MTPASLLVIIEAARVGLHASRREKGQREVLMSSNDQYRLEMILEDINGKFNLVLEGHDALRKETRDTSQYLNEKIDLNNSLIKTVHDSLDAKIDAVRDELKDDIHAVGEKVDGHEARIQQLERRAA